MRPIWFCCYYKANSQTDRFDNLTKKLKSSVEPIDPPIMTTPPYYDFDETYKY